MELMNPTDKFDSVPVAALLLAAKRSAAQLVWGEDIARFNALVRNLRGLGYRTTVNLSGEVFEDLDLRNFHFDGCDLSRSVFHRCDLRGVSFRHSFLNGAEFADCNFNGASVDSAEMKSAILRRCLLAEIENFSDQQKLDVCPIEGAV